MDKKERTEKVNLDGRNLTLQQVEAVARHHTPAELTEAARQRVQETAETVQHLIDSDQLIYGVNTGFGIFASRRIAIDKATQLSRNLILSHATGLGTPFPEDVVRAAIVIRANTLAHGHSGVRPKMIDSLLGILNTGITPYIPSRGSLGSSGDLAPLAHLALVLSSPPDGHEDRYSGQAWFRGKLMSGADAMEKAGLQRIVLGPKEGLAITNGATFSTSLLALACIDAVRILKTAEVAAACSLEALLGISSAFDSRLHDARLHPGQRTVAQRILAITRESGLLDLLDDHVQDAYTLRCIPQIIGPAWDLLDFVEKTVQHELNAATDNPLFFGDQAISGGNFHGEPIGLASDYLKITLSNVGAFSERRTYRMTSAHTNFGLPPMLVANHEDVGLQSGLMMLQYTAASLVLENLSLAGPNSTHSLPTSAGQEDFNANSTTAARHLSKVIDNLSHILAIELLTAAQALDLRQIQYPQALLGLGTRAAHRRIRELVPFCDADRPHSEDIETIAKLVIGGDLIAAVESAME